MDQLVIEHYNEAYVRVRAIPGIMMEIAEHFVFMVDNYYHMPAYKTGRWDGKIRLLDRRSGLIYKGLIHKIMDFGIRNGYETIIDPKLEIRNAIPDDAGYKLAEHFKGIYKPRDYQNDAIVFALRSERGLLLSPTASGKSYIIYLISRYYGDMKKKRILIIVPTTNLVAQMANDFVEYNRNEPLDIHRIMSGVTKETENRFVISTWQSIYQLDEAWFNQFHVVFGDEVHGFKATCLKSIMENATNVKYRFGTTGTLDDSQTNKMVLEGLFGPVKTVAKTKELMDRKDIANLKIKCFVLKHSGFSYKEKKDKRKKYKEEIDWLCENEKRNLFIKKLTLSLKGNTLILFRYIEHGKALANLFENTDKKVHLIYGDVDGDVREGIQKIVDNSEKENHVIVASFGTFSQGNNVKQLHNVIFASPYKTKIKNLQSIGRALRLGKEKESATLYDLADDLGKSPNYVLDHFKSRIHIYSREQFDFEIHNVNME